MRKVLSGSALGLVFALACDDTATPPDVSGQQEALLIGSSPCDSPQVAFDSETGRLLILDPELNRRIRARYGLGADDSGTGPVTMEWTSGLAKSGQDRDYIHPGPEQASNAPC